MSFQHRVVQGLGVEKRTHPPHLLGRILLVLTLLVLGTQAVQAETCIGGAVSQGNLASPPDLEVTGECFVAIGKTSYFGNVNILAGGILLFYKDDYKDPIVIMTRWAIIQKRTSGRAPSLLKMVGN